MKKHLILTILALFTLSACGLGGANAEPTDDPGAILTQAAELAAQGLTQTAAAMPAEVIPTNTMVPTNTTIPTNALAGSVTPTSDVAVSPTVDSLLPTMTATAFVIPATPTPFGGGGVSDPNCYLAFLSSESDPHDGDPVHNLNAFEKTWTLKNIGSCTWPAGVTVQWMGTKYSPNRQYDGDNFVGSPMFKTLGPDTVVVVWSAPVRPQEKIDIELKFQAPENPGSYIVYWRVFSPTGDQISIGYPGADLWVLFFSFADGQNPDN